MLNQTVLDLHHLDDVQLIAIGRAPGVLPGDAVSVGEQAATEPSPLRRLVREDMLPDDWLPLP